MFSFGEKFKELWEQIPLVISFRDYVGLANVIDDARTGREITQRDEQVLLNALETFRNAREIEVLDLM